MVASLLVLMSVNPAASTVCLLVKLCGEVLEYMRKKQRDNEITFVRELLVCAIARKTKALRPIRSVKLY